MPATYLDRPPPTISRLWSARRSGHSLPQAVKWTQLPATVTSYARQLLPKATTNRQLCRSLGAPLTVGAFSVQFEAITIAKPRPKSTTGDHQKPKGVDQRNGHFVNDSIPPVSEECHTRANLQDTSISNAKRSQRCTRTKARPITVSSQVGTPIIHFDR